MAQFPQITKGIIHKGAVRKEGVKLHILFPFSWKTLRRLLHQRHGNNEVGFLLIHSNPRD
jgi:hypothetical protein